MRGKRKAEEEAGRQKKKDDKRQEDGYEEGEWRKLGDESLF